MDAEAYKKLKHNLEQIESLAQAIKYNPNPVHESAKAAAEMILRNYNEAWNTLYREQYKAT